MLNKVCAGLVVAFWAAMMAALVRVEVFPKPSALEMYPTERVLKKIFANADPARLDIYYRKRLVGFCAINIQPRQNEPSPQPVSTGQPTNGYEVKTDLKMQLSMFGMPARLWLVGTSEFNPKLEMEGFDVTTTVGDSRVYITGDDLTKKVKMVTTFGDIRDERTFDFNQIRSAGIASAFGMPGLSSMSFLGGGLAGSAGASAGGYEMRPRSVTKTYFDHLEIAGDSQRVYLIDTQIDDQMWTKMWVDDSGQVLKVTTSLGLEMLSDALTYGTDYQVRRPMRRGRR